MQDTPQTTRTILCELLANSSAFQWFSQFICSALANSFLPIEYLPQQNLNISHDSTTSPDIIDNALSMKPVLDVLVSHTAYQASYVKVVATRYFTASFVFRTNTVFIVPTPIVACLLMFGRCGVACTLVMLASTTQIYLLLHLCRQPLL